MLQESAYSALICRACGGMFYPETEFSKHLDVVMRILPPQITAQEIAPPNPTGRLLVGERGAACPGCGAPMRTFNYAYRSGIFLGRCPACRGLWVEPGQMLRMARFRVMNPGVEHMTAGVVKVRAEREPKPGIEDRYQKLLPRLSLIPIPLLPVSNALELRREPIAMWSIIVLNSVAFFVIRLTLTILPLIPAQVTSGKHLYTLITYQFTHISFLHFLENMIALRAFGDRIEDRLGSWTFASVYLLLGVIAGLAQVFMDPDSPAIVYGASGCVSGITGLYLVFYPFSSIRISGVFFSVPFPALTFIVCWFVLQFTIPSSAHIAVAAHLGGFVAGAWIGGLVRILRLGEKKRRR